MTRKTRQTKETQDKRWQRLDAIISNNYSASNMSNSKWVKLLRIAAFHAEEVPCMNYKLVYDVEVFRSFTEDAEEAIEEKWFREPLIYKEIEWVEFPVICSLRHGTHQNLSSLKEAFDRAGKFPLQVTKTGLRVNAYVKV